MGCGSWGGNSIDENLNWTHFINKVNVVRVIPEKKPELDENAIINRLGFNNKGVDHLVKRLKSRNYKGVVGVNIGANKSSKGEKRIADYVECYKKVYDLSDYITINISSPNTPDLRDLHNEANINQLLSSIKKEKAALRSQKPIFLKISPDETKDTIEIILKAVKKYEITGLVLTNTTIDKTNLRNEALKSEAGGLSGKPLFAKSTETIKVIKSLDNTIPVIGVGGVIDHSDYIATVSYTHLTLPTILLV